MKLLLICFTFGGTVAGAYSQPNGPRHIANQLRNRLVCVQQCADPLRIAVSIMGNRQEKNADYH
jgi:hypothetical protein